MESGKLEDRLIKHNISGYVDAPFARIKALVTLVSITIAGKHAKLGTELQFTCIICSKVRPDGTTKGAEGIILRLLAIEAMEGGIMINDFRG